jgi:hypothetical protein
LPSITLSKSSLDFKNTSQCIHALLWASSLHTKCPPLQASYNAQFNYTGSVRFLYPTSTLRVDNSPLVTNTVIESPSALVFQYHFTYTQRLRRHFTEHGRHFYYKPGLVSVVTLNQFHLSLRNCSSYSFYTAARTPFQVLTPRSTRHRS